MFQLKTFLIEYTKGKGAQSSWFEFSKLARTFTKHATHISSVKINSSLRNDTYGSKESVGALVK